MKILLTVENLVELAGSKQYVHALAEAFGWHLGHDVTVVYRGHGTGPMRDAFFDMPRVDFVKLDALEHSRFDLGIISPASCAEAVRYCDKSINVIHGIVEPEAPINYADAYVYVSEEAMNHWLPLRQTQDGLFNDHVIRNAVDVRRYRPTTALKDCVETIAHFSNYSELPGLREFCEAEGITFHRIKDKPFAEVHRLLNDSDLVFAVGRSAYEAMACGREVAFCDNRGYYDSDSGWSDGLASWTYWSSREHNCSGRRTKAPVNSGLYTTLVSNYKFSNGGMTNRQTAVEQHDHVMIAKKLLSLCP